MIRAVLICGLGSTGKSSVATELAEILRKRQKHVLLIRFDKLRQELAPKGADPFSKDQKVKDIIYKKAIKRFSTYLKQGHAIILDWGGSTEANRMKLKEALPQLKICHLCCPFMVALYRDTKRSLLDKEHERGRFLHLHAIFDLLNPFKKEKFPQPGITYRFEYPECADVHLSTFMKNPRQVAEEIYQKLD